MWDLEPKSFAWGTAGYFGAISTGRANCGLLIGGGIAIGLRCGNGTEDLPQAHAEQRNKAIGAVRELYLSFVEEFKQHSCRELLGCDLSIPDNLQRYVKEKKWKQVCDVCLPFVLNKCMEMSDDGKI